MDVKEYVCVRVAGLDSEDLYFQQQEQERIRALRQEAEKRVGQEYRDSHKKHCFRCGTPSLVEVQHEKVKIDVCVNEGCGAVHLDPGELEAILQDAKSIKRIHTAVLSIFR